MAASTAVLDLTTTPVQHRGCDRAFTLVTEDATVRLSVWARATGPDAGEHVVDGEDWAGELVQGEDLLAHLCDDSPDGPGPSEDGWWPVTGTIRVELDEEADPCERTATAVLMGGVVDPAGAAVPLPDLDLETLGWGCALG